MILVTGANSFVGKALTAHATDPDHGQFAPKPADIVRKIQGTQADVIQLAMIRMDRFLAETYAAGEVKMISQVHDELLLEVPPAEVDAIKDLLSKRKSLYDTL